MNDDAQQQAERIYRDVAFAAFREFARVETALPPFCAVLTDCESITAAVGSRFRPAFSRKASRNTVLIFSHTPDVLQRYQ